MFRSYLLRIRPNKAQVATFEHILATNCDLYNAALQERRDAWRMCGKSISYRHQQDQLTELHREHEDIAALALQVARDPLRRVDLAFKAFFRRVKAGDTPGYPRFRAKVPYIQRLPSLGSVLAPPRVPNGTTEQVTLLPLVVLKPPTPGVKVPFTLLVKLLMKLQANGSMLLLRWRPLTGAM